MSRKLMYPNHAANQDDGPVIRVVRAGAVLDPATGAGYAPGAVTWVEQADGSGRLAAVGTVEDVERAVEGENGSLKSRRVETLRPGDLVVPGLVNAHVHLDLTDVGRQPFDGDFVSWVKMLQAKRDMTEAGVRRAVRHGAALCRAAGVTMVGDIAWWRGASHAIDELRQTGLRGVGFAEIIGLDEAYPTQPLRSLAMATAMRREVGGVRVGLQPHAPYSTAKEIYQAATEAAEQHDLPLSTHLAEMDAEFEFVAGASGIFRRFIEELGSWRTEYEAKYQTRQRPVEWMTPWLRRRRWVLAHCNYVNDDEITLLAETGASVAYCPRASEYFGHRGHRYRDMLEAGVNVCLGTDSIVCHGTLGVIDEMRRLHERDGTDAMTLLKMGTVNGCRALGAAPPPADSGWIAIEGAAKDATDARQAWENVLRSDAPLSITEL